MQFSITHKPSYSMAVAYLTVGDELYAESGAFVAMNTAVSVSAFLKGGVVESAKRKFLAKESLFITRFRGLAEGAWVALSPAYPGDIDEVEVPPEGLVVQPGSYLAHTAGVKLGTEVGTLARIIGREGAFVVTLRGEGKALLSSYGGLQRFDLAEGQRMVVDTGHYVASGQNVRYDVGLLEGVTTSVLSGEGLVATLTGPGPVFIQTRSPQELNSWLFPPRPQDEGFRRR